MTVSSIELAWKVREGGIGRHRRDYLDFVIDGQSVKDLVGDDWASCLGWMSSNQNEKALKRLLVEEPADLPNDRCSLYVCPECGDIDCGAITIVIERQGDRVIWRDFGYENTYEDIVQTEGYEEIGPFVFSFAAYSRVLMNSTDMEKP